MLSVRSVGRSVLIILLLPLSLATTQMLVYAQSGGDLTISYIEAEPIPEESVYEVRAYVSVVDAHGVPVLDLDRDAFSVLESGSEVEITDVGKSVEGMSILLMLDVSGSMLGMARGEYQTKLGAAQAAADSFVQALDAADSVAIMSFGEDNTVEIGFTNDHNAVRNAIYELEAVAGQGTCLYNAAFDAVKRLADAPPGNRALVLFTDGIDETQTGQVCSHMTFDDVVERATARTTRVPIYTIALGQRVNEQELARLTELTGGRTTQALSEDQLRELFELMANYLKNQYIIGYRSTNVSGEHSLTVTVRYQGQTFQDQRAFFAAAPPPTVKFVSPTSGEQIPDVMYPTVKVTSPGAVALVRFFVDGKLVKEVDKAPYRFEWDTSDLTSGQYILKAEVYDAEGRMDFDELHLALTLPPTPTPQPVPSPASTKEVVVPVDEEAASTWPRVVLLGLLGLLIAGGGAIAWKKRHDSVGSAEHESPHHEGNGWDDIWLKPPTEEDYPPEEDQDPDEAVTLDVFEDKTHDVTDAIDPIAVLKVVRSLNLEVGHELTLHNQSTTRIGRSQDNDVMVPDSPVSRHHGEIRYVSADDEFRLIDLASKYGTKVNDVALVANAEPGKPLRDGDRITLGTRTVLRFERVQSREKPDRKDTQGSEGGFDTQDFGNGSW